MLNKIIEIFKSFHLFRNLVWLKFYIHKSPAVINLDVANGCNLRCSFCVTQSKELTKTVMKKNIAFSHIDKIKNSYNKVFRIYFQKDGEPLLNKDLEEIVRYAKSKNIAKFYSVITNGVYLTEERFNSLVNSGITDITISLDSCNRDEYIINKGSDDYDVVVSNIEKIISLLKKSFKDKVTVRVKSVSFNIESNKLFKQKWKNRGLTVDVHQLHNWAGKSEFGIAAKKTAYPNKICSLPFHTLVINSDSTVSTCCVDGKRESLHGNLINSDVRNLWLSNSFANIRKGLAEKKPISICVNCDYWVSREGIPKYFAKRFYE